MKFLGMAGLLVLAIVLIAALAPSGPPRPVDGSDACYMAQKFITDQLKAPSTADFQSCREATISTGSAANSWTVITWVDAQNSFGAKLRERYLVKVSHVSTDKDGTTHWHLDQLVAAR